MIPGHPKQYLNFGSSIIALKDTIDIYTTLTNTINISSLLANDRDMAELYPLTLTAVSNFIGGTATISGSNILFNCTALAGEPAGFTYTVKNSVGVTAKVEVVCVVKALPPIQCNPDNYSVQQADTLVINQSSLLTNDVTAFPPLTITTTQNVVGGTLTKSGTNYNFKATALTGSTAGFKYNVTNAISQTGQGNVSIIITPLPRIKALLFDTSTNATNFMNTYSPPTMSTIFNTWHRASGKYFYPNGVGATGEAASWQYIVGSPSPQNDYFYFPTNSSHYNSLLSLEELTDYDLEVTLSSTSNDDDTIGLIALFRHDNVEGTNHAIIINRNVNGNNPRWFGITYLYYNTTNTMVPTYLIEKNNLASIQYKPPGNRHGWEKGGRSRVRLEKRGYKLKAWCSAFDSDVLINESMIEYDISSSNTIRPFFPTAKTSYGLTTYSQSNSTYTDIKLIGGLNVSQVLDAQTGKIYNYNTATYKWDVDSSKTIADLLGYPREVYNPQTSQLFKINADKTITKL